MKIQTNTNQPQQQAQGGQGAPKKSVYITLIPEDRRKGSLLGFATVYYHGIMIRGIRIYTVPSKDGQDLETFYAFPNQLRMSKAVDQNGNRIPEYDENGRPIYDDIAAPCTKETRNEINEMIDAELSQKLAE